MSTITNIRTLECGERYFAHNGYQLLDRLAEDSQFDLVLRDSSNDDIVFAAIERCEDAIADPQVSRETAERTAISYFSEHFFGEARVRFDVLAVLPLADDRAFFRHHLGILAKD